jgi:hypothetical protein
MPQQEIPNVSAFLREMAARCRSRSQDCFDVAVALELRTLADELDQKADSIETPAIGRSGASPGNGQTSAD